ncbi:protein of unknown function [Agrobacterium pusense]|uniref:Uncharacterized protein n=1 Tax=Agrobacterium pusense TaxID=648995 RepID=U4Q1I8_9HYPH|nr:protein of unknown function [Agrobacterium pusense]
MRGQPRHWAIIITRTVFPINPFAFRLQEPSLSHIRVKGQCVNHQSMFLAQRNASRRATPETGPPHNQSN